MALSDAVKRRILKANAIGEHRISALSEQDFIDLASRHGGIEKFTANGASAPKPAPPPTPQPDPPVHWRQKSIDEASRKRETEDPLTEVLTDPVTQTSTPPTTEDPLAEVLTEQSPQYATKEEALEKGGGLKGFVDWASQQPTDFDIWLSKTPIHYQKAYREQGPEKQKEIRETFTETTKPKLGKPTGDEPGGEFSFSPEIIEANPEIDPNTTAGRRLLDSAAQISPGQSLEMIGPNGELITLYGAGTISSDVDQPPPPEPPPGTPGDPNQPPPGGSTVPPPQQGGDDGTTPFDEGVRKGEAGQDRMIQHDLSIGMSPADIVNDLVLTGGLSQQEAQRLVDESMDRINAGNQGPAQGGDQGPAQGDHLFDSPSGGIQFRGGNLRGGVDPGDMQGPGFRGDPNQPPPGGPSQPPPILSADSLNVTPKFRLVNGEFVPVTTIKERGPTGKTANHFVRNPDGSFSHTDTNLIYGPDGQPLSDPFAEKDASAASGSFGVDRVRSAYLGDPMGAGEEDPFAADAPAPVGFWGFFPDRTEKGPRVGYRRDGSRYDGPPEQEPAGIGGQPSPGDPNQTPPPGDPNQPPPSGLPRSTVSPTQIDWTGKPAFIRQAFEKMSPEEQQNFLQANPDFAKPFQDQPPPPEPPPGTPGDPPPPGPPGGPPPPGPLPSGEGGGRKRRVFDIMGNVIKGGLEGYLFGNPLAGALLGGYRAFKGDPNQQPPPDPPPGGTQQPPPGGTQQPPPYGTQQPPPYGTQQPPPYGTQQPPPGGPPQQAPPGYSNQQPPPGDPTQPPPSDPTQPPPGDPTQPPPGDPTQPPPSDPTQPPPGDPTQPPPSDPTQPPPSDPTQPPPSGDPNAIPPWLWRFYKTILSDDDNGTGDPDQGGPLTPTGDGEMYGYGKSLEDLLGIGTKPAFSVDLDEPAIYGKVESSLTDLLDKDAFSGVSELELADLKKQQEADKAQSMLELDRLGILRGGDTAGVLGDLKERQNRERMNLLANQQLRRDTLWDRALGLGQGQGQFRLGAGNIGLTGQIQGGKQALDLLLGLRGLDVREKEADARTALLQNQIDVANAKLGLEESDATWNKAADTIRGLYRLGERIGWNNIKKLF
jgi:hypothetical protein